MLEQSANQCNPRGLKCHPSSSAMGSDGNLSRASSDLKENSNRQAKMPSLVESQSPQSDEQSKLAQDEILAICCRLWLNPCRDCQSGTNTTTASHYAQKPKKQKKRETVLLDLWSQTGWKPDHGTPWPPSADGFSPGVANRARWIQQRVPAKAPRPELPRASGWI